MLRPPTPLPSRAQIVFVVWLTLPPWRGASVLYLAFVAKYLEVLEPDIDLFAENTQQRVRDAWGNVRHRVASHVTRNAKEILGAVAQLLSDTAASTVQPGGARQPAGAVLVDEHAKARALQPPGCRAEEEAMMVAAGVGTRSQHHSRERRRRLRVENRHRPGALPSAT